MRQKKTIVGACALALVMMGVGAAMGSPVSYTDTKGDQVGSTNPARDIQSVTVDNDASNLIFTINLDPTATLGTVSFDYGIGITTGPGAGGDLSTNGTTHGNPYSRTISIASSQGGMTDWVGLFPAGANGTGTKGSTANPWTSYGFNDYVWTGTPTNSWGANVDNVQTGEPMTTQAGKTGLSSITVTVPMSDFANLHLAAGSTFLFDIYSTGTGAGQTAYDSLADQAATNSTNSATTQYDGAVLDSYTVQAVPEPVSAGVLACGAILGFARRRSRTK